MVKNMKKKKNFKNAQKMFLREKEKQKRRKPVRSRTAVVLAVAMLTLATVPAELVLAALPEEESLLNGMIISTVSKGMGDIGENVTRDDMDVMQEKDDADKLQRAEEIDDETNLKKINDGKDDRDEGGGGTEGKTEEGDGTDGKAEEDNGTDGEDEGDKVLAGNETNYDGRANGESKAADKVQADSGAAEDIFASMPEMGSEAFTAWFFGHADRQELWDWVSALLEGEEVRGYSGFMDWYAIHEDEIGEAWQTFSGVTMYRSSVGDLWDDWNGRFTWSGEGSEDTPYQIDSLSELMGLSEKVASGEDFDGQYFELTRDIDLDYAINSGNWNPIGWYQERAELAGEVAHPFRGHFDGRDHTISGLRIVNPSISLKNIGLFGVIDSGSVCNLTVLAEEVSGVDNVALLAGRLTGNTVIYNVTVKGYAHSEGNAGGIAGEILGDTDRVTVENCHGYGIVLNSTGTESCVGGIGGSVTGAYLVDNEVLTQDGNADRIQGKGCVGGIAGSMDHAEIYNSYVDGTIGGNGSQAAGGIVGEYRDGVLVLARMAGDVARTNLGTAKREGIFIGNRRAGTKFTYGTEKSDNVAYLYTTEDNRGKAVFGSVIDGDNTYTKSAHIGYWTENEKKYVTVAGKTEYPCKDRYFYEELEDGVRYIVTQKLSRELYADQYEDGLDFHVDHFAPGYMGQPMRGYLVYIPVIKAVNANGTLDTDVAALTAMPLTNSSYYRTMDKDHAAAVMPGATVTVLTAPNNTKEDRYQMTVERTEAGGVKAPTYTNEQGEEIPMNYVNGGSYTFVMPECDTELNVEYEKVTTKLSMVPAETSIHVIQTRSGDRKQPQLVTEVKNAQGNLIARYINGEQDTSVEVQPVTVHVEHNGAGGTVDRTVQWSVDDKNLIINQSERGYTDTDARILPNMDSDFIQEIINREVQAQADNQYREKINNTVYTRDAVVTATTNPDTSVDYKPVYANCRVHVTFQILDHTTVRVEGMTLNRKNVVMTVTRKLSGNRYAPTETITCSQPVVLTANLYPVRPFYKQVSWADQGSGKILSLKSSGDFTQDCTVSVKFDASGKNNPAWIQNIINADNEKRASDRNVKLEGKRSHTEVITAVSEDQTHGHVTADCQITVRFVTVDETTLNQTSSISGSRKSSGGGGGGGSSKGASSGTSNTAAGVLPAYVVKGSWSRNAEGKWTFADDKRSYANEWAAVYNPYADTSRGQGSYDWFRFDTEGFLVTGWYTDADGNVYYLNPEADGAQGCMVTGWKWIGEHCYYMKELSDGTRGALQKNTTTPDGYQVDDQGRWIVDGVVQTKMTVMKENS